MAESTVTADSKLTSSDTRRRIWAIVGASSGNLVEWFDFYVYSFCSLYFAHIFFPSGNTTTQLLQTAGVFAAGFLMRPIGGWLFGRIADKHGRKKSMLLSVCMMCFGSLAAIFTVPILSALQNVSSPYAAFGLVMCALLIVSFYTSISGILKAEMFPAQVRALGVGLSYAVANAIFGGSAEYVALSLKSIGMETAFFWYVTLMAVVAFLVSLMLHRKGKGMRL
ncbi:TPA: MFS transporter [Escherichia coli]|uniref:MFS transporter n=1 Tax=Escherichia coli TaxID=562 RepID=UPI0005B52F23|nr:MFS transporter [Escherichia coli]HBB0815630.1 MFS transporter [Escherichia coli]